MQDLRMSISDWQPELLSQALVECGCGGEPAQETNLARHFQLRRGAPRREKFRTSSTIFRTEASSVTSQISMLIPPEVSGTSLRLVPNTQ
jgi:hypothetical protein